MSGFATDVAKQVLVEDKSLKEVDYGQAFETAAVSGVFGGVMELGSAAISKVVDSAAVLVKKAKIPEKFKKFTLPGSKGKSVDTDLDMPAAGKSKGADLNMPAAGKSTGADLDTPSASKSTGSLPDMPQGTKNSQIDMEDLSGQAGPSVELPEPAGKPRSGVPELPTGGKVDLDYIVVDPSTITPTNSGPLKMNLQFFAESGSSSKGIFDYKEYGIIPYDNRKYRTPGFEKHHGVLNEWAEHNIPGYTKKNAPTILLSPETHGLTKKVYQEWLRANYGKPVGISLDWSKVSKAEAMKLMDDMFDAANVPQNVRMEYLELFDLFIIGG